MATKETGNFFGLFGCESAKERDESSKKRPIVSEELEEGEVVEYNEPNFKENVHFDTLISNFKQEESQKLTFKETKKCFVCSTNSPKYTCPKCGMKTCSLNCCLVHKKDFGCDGVRDRLSFVPLKSYSEQNFHSDCKFLDETCEAVNNSSRTVQNNSSKEVSNWTNRFIQEAMGRQICYKKLPPSFKKAKLNKSMYVYKEKLISWDVEFVLPFCLVDSAANCTSIYETVPSSEAFYSVTFKKSRISENRVLCEVIHDIISNHQGSHISSQLNDAVDRKDAIKPKMTAYSEAPAGDIAALFRHDSGKFHYLLDTNKTLLDNFSHKTIVEYPTIVVILRRYLSDYTIQNEVKLTTGP